MMNSGVYKGYLKDVAVGLSAKKKSPQMGLRFIIRYFANNGEWSTLQQEQERTVYLYFSDKAWPYTEETLKRLGFNGDVENPTFAQAIYDGADGIDLECRHEDYEGQPQERWQFAGGGGGKEMEPLTKDLVRTLNARWKAANGTPKAPAGRPASPPAKPAGKKPEPSTEDQAAAAAMLNEASDEPIKF